MREAGFKGVWKNQRSYTLPEALSAVAIAGVLAAISPVILPALLERWRVEAAADQLAADQLAADMRFAHATATQQPTRQLTGSPAAGPTRPPTAPSRGTRHRSRRTPPKATSTSA